MGDEKPILLAEGSTRDNNLGDVLRDVKVLVWNRKVVANTGVDLGYCFAHCSTLKKIYGLDNWTVSNIHHLYYMFSGCNKLEQIYGIESWDVSNVVNMDGMFIACKNLRFVNCQWNTISLRECLDMFSGCNKLEQIYGIESWDVSNVVIMDCMFEDCETLKLLNISGWNFTDKYRSATDMFARCKKLTKIITSEKTMSAILKYQITNGADSQISIIKSDDVEIDEDNLDVYTFITQYINISRVRFDYVLKIVAKRPYHPNKSLTDSTNLPLLISMMKRYKH